MHSIDFIHIVDFSWDNEVVANSVITHCICRFLLNNDSYSTLTNLFPSLNPTIYLVSTFFLFLTCPWLRLCQMAQVLPPISSTINKTMPENKYPLKLILHLLHQVFASEKHSSEVNFDLLIYYAKASKVNECRRRACRRRYNFWLLLPSIKL